MGSRRFAYGTKDRVIRCAVAAGCTQARVKVRSDCRKARLCKAPYDIANRGIDAPNVHDDDDRRRTRAGPGRPGGVGGDDPPSGGSSAACSSRSPHRSRLPTADVGDRGLPREAAVNAANAAALEIPTKTRRLKRSEVAWVGSISGATIVTQSCAQPGPNPRTAVWALRRDPLAVAGNTEHGSAKGNLSQFESLDSRNDPRTRARCLFWRGLG